MNHEAGRLPDPILRGNVEPILNEVAHALDRLLADAEPTVIDLASLPFAPGEIDELERRLGAGELVAELEALGPSRIHETQYPGVWWVEHRNSEGAVVGRYLEITTTPDILKAQEPDMRAGRARLGETLATQGG